MIRFIVAHDSSDTELGTYFDDCKNQLLGILEERSELVNGDIVQINGSQCNAAYIDIIVAHHHPHPFIFVAYSHGSEVALASRHGNYVEKGCNSHNFKGSLFYTTACSAGKELGPQLIDKDSCLAFVGYEGPISVHKNAEKREISKNCDNAGIIDFLINDSSIGESFKKMKDYYTSQIDRLENVNDMLFAAALTYARESLVCLGNRDLRKCDLFTD